MHVSDTCFSVCRELFASKAVKIGLRTKEVVVGWDLEGEEDFVVGEVELEVDCIA